MMVRSAVFGGQSKPTLEIQPNSSFIVLYGSPTEAAPTELAGKLILTNTEPMPIKSIKVSLVGARKVQWITDAVTPQHISRKVTFMTRDQHIYPSDGCSRQVHTIGPNSHEWHFKFDIPGNTEESIEGLSMGYIIYHLNATVERGFMSKNLTATKHIRIIRTLGQDSMESLPMEQINDDIWPDKIAYKIVVPQKNYIVGTPITADIQLIPIKKGLSIGKIKMEVVEQLELYTDTTGGHPSTTHHRRELTVASHEQDLPGSAQQLMTPEMEALGPEAFIDECYRFKMNLDLPKSLRSCRQSVHTDRIQIAHKLRIYVNLHNPEGHVSQLLVKNHLVLFISPNLPPNEDQTVLVDPQILASTAVLDEVNQAAPPLYERHQLDTLYHEIDPADFYSRPGSVVQTPHRALSRNPSHENLPASIDSIADQGVSSNVLHSRLTNLRLTQVADETGRPGHLPRAFSYQSHHSPDTGTPQTNTASSSAMESPGSYFPSPDNVRFDMEALVRTPSYGTAVRTPIYTPVSEGLPSYEKATSQPPSPNMSSTVVHSAISPRNSADILRDETQRNTQLNSRRESPTGHRTSYEARR